MSLLDAAFSILLLLLPVVIVAVVVWLIVKTKLVRHAEYMDRAVRHMDRLEQNTERMIELLESIEHRLHQVGAGARGPTDTDPATFRPAAPQQ
jgi:hypothetical protein